MGIEPACKCRRCKRREFYPWVWKISWRKKWQPTSRILASKIPWTEEPGGLQSMGLQRLRHDWALMNNVIRKGKNIANDDCLVFLSINWSHLLPLLIGLSTAEKPWSPVPPGSYPHFKRRRGLFSLSPKWNWDWERSPPEKDSGGSSMAPSLPFNQLWWSELSEGLIPLNGITWWQKGRGVDL